MSTPLRLRCRPKCTALRNLAVYMDLPVAGQAQLARGILANDPR